MKSYSIIAQYEIGMILDIVYALGDRCDPYLAKLIEQILANPGPKFRTVAIQEAIYELLEKHDLHKD